MKPLELVIYPPLPFSLRMAVAVFHTIPPGLSEMKSKRLTGAELAAEYWRADGDQFAICEGITWEGQVGEWPTGEKAALHRQRILERFATMPHYDEVTE